MPEFNWIPLPSLWIARVSVSLQLRGRNLCDPLNRRVRSLNPLSALRLRPKYFATQRSKLYTEILVVRRVEKRFSLFLFFCKTQQLKNFQIKFLNSAQIYKILNRTVIIIPLSPSLDDKFAEIINTKHTNLHIDGMDKA